jgi:ADP-heptose:LPS heptosyltransferase
LIPEAPRVLIYRLGSLGDTCVALPAFRLVRKAYPRAWITLLTNLPVNMKAAPAPSLLKGMGLVDDYLDYPVGTRDLHTLIQLAWQLRRRRIEVVVNLAAWRGERALRRDARFFRISGIRTRIGFDIGADNGLRRKATGETEHETERLLRRLAALGLADLTDRRWFDLELRLEELQRARQILHEGGVDGNYLAFSLGTKVPANDWGQENWLRLIRSLGAACPQYGCVVLGSPDETARASECLEGWPGAKLALCGRTSPRESAAVLAGAMVFVGHDSGPMHLAAAVGTPCVAVFSARNPPGQWFPLGAGHEILYRKVSCAECGLDECIAERKRCISGISVDEVAAAVQRQTRRLLLNTPTRIPQSRPITN